jgi:hypothetical protein
MLLKSVRPQAYSDCGGGKDKWPLHFYPAMLMMRILGREGMLAAYDGKNGGYNNPEVVKAFQLYKDLAALQPFQKSYLENTYPEAAGTFHDGRTAFHLMGTLGPDVGAIEHYGLKGTPGREARVVFLPGSQRWQRSRERHLCESEWVFGGERCAESDR